MDKGRKWVFGRRDLEMTLLLGTMLLSCRVWTPDGVAAEEKVMNWRQFPVPYGTPETPRPPDEEFLKLLPPLRPEPKVDKKTQDRGFAIWWGDYSVQLFSEQPPLPTDIGRKAEVRTPAGEDEPLVLGLWGIRDMGPVKLTVKQTPFPLTIRRVDFAPRYIPSGYDNLSQSGFDGSQPEGGREVGIATYLLPEDTAEVCAGVNAVFWIDVRVPAATKPGEYTASMELTVPENDSPIRLPVTIRVLNYRLPKPDIAYGMYFRPFASDKVLPPRYKTPECLHLYWRDMARHGMTSATIYHRGERFYDDSGRLSLEQHPDIQMLREMMADGLVTKEVPVMFLDAGGIKQDDPAAATKIRDELDRLNLPEFLYYGPDEPAVNEQSLAGFKSLQPLREKFRIITAIGDQAATSYADLLDVWVINSGVLTPEVQHLASKKGAEVWTYDCFHRGMGNAPWSRYYAGLYTWALELKGNFLWCYTENYYREGGAYLPWGPIFCYVLPSDKGLLSSIEWETRREGVEDYRTLRLLEKYIGVNPKSVIAQEALEWLNKTKSRVDWYLARNMPPCLYPWDGPEMYPMCPNFDPCELSEVRAKAIDYINRLSTDSRR